MPAVAFIANAAEKGYAENNNKKGRFQDRDLYLVVYGLDGVVQAHGANEKMAGRNVLDLRDIDRKPFVQERVDLAERKGTFWQDYKSVEPEQSYCEKLNEPSSAAASTAGRCVRMLAKMLTTVLLMLAIAGA